MNNRKVEEKLKKAVDNITPDLSSRIVEACRGIEIDTSVPRRRKKNNVVEYITRFVAVAAVLVLAINLGANYIRVKNDTRVEAVIGIDVNPSIEIEINSKDRVIAVNPLNDDAARILTGMDLEGTQTRVAINAIIGAMLYNGYLVDEATSSILISVESGDEQKATMLRESLVADIDGMLGAFSCDAVVIGQNVPGDNSIDMLAANYGISQGKAELVHKIMEIDSSYGVNNLANMTITELSALLIFIQSEEYAMEHDEEAIDISGSVSIADSSNRTNVAAVSPTASPQPTPNRMDEVASNNASVASVSGNDLIPTVSDNQLTTSVSSNELTGSVSNNSVSNNTVSSNSVSVNSVGGNNMHADSAASVSANDI